MGKNATVGRNTFGDEKPGTLFEVFTNVKTLYFLSLLCIYQLSCGQESSTLKLIEQWIQRCDSHVLPNFENDLYIIDGIPYSGNGIDAELVKINDLNQISIDFIIPNDENWPFHHRPKGIIIIIIRVDSQMKRKRIVSAIKSLTPKFPSLKIKMRDQIFKFPMLSINDNFISPYEALNVMNDLKPRKIKNIHFLKQVPGVIYGAQAKYGWVRVSLKD